ncbi:hypothetical protein MKK63_28105 [Methylobacterium sp. J-088]|uniref:hypothetical protein n=1 Tax=Methylobacterium sp. J-088 TaxID=2836664 RepID=UPI001FB9A2F6|nr:hypothetical protein [Methylobacterium sp. J-088]MCJ2066528.1 hypothetical protein [Methylobacterium sp. J-088]
MPDDAISLSAADAQNCDRLPYGRLRSILAELPPTGDRGFEGLIAAACTLLAGVPFRLVGSGRQFGRDAEGTVSGAAVMVEAKRYTSRLPFEALSAKLTEAIERSGREVEVWCAAATVPFDAAYAGDLRRMGDRHGTTVLVLDWAQPLPPLAVLLAVARDAVLEWFGRYDTISAPVVASEIEAVAASALFGGQADAIHVEFRAGSLGLASARRANAAWLAAHFRSVGLALQRFNQALAPLDASMRPAPFARARLEGRIREAMRCWSPEPRAVVLTGPAGRSGGRGDEGNGKSWAAVRAWLEFEDGPGRPRPMLLLMTSHMWRAGDETRPLELLSRLAAEQTGSRGAGGEDRWRARLERWLAVPEGSTADRSPAVVIVLDGVNERTHHPWPALISALLREAGTKALGVVVTTRRGIYERDLAPRLPRAAVLEIGVEAFSDEELDHLLLLAGKRPESVCEPLRGFLRNPRILSVGLDLLDRLDPDEVGTERLLFEYLRKRQEGRASAGGHTAEQFAQVLVNHAREIRERLLNQTVTRQAVTFDDRSIRERLGVPVDQAALAADLGDIVDSGFIEIVDGVRRRYILREHGRTLGLGLLIAEELKDAAGAGETGLDRLLETIVDPIRAIDETALVLLGALDVALADPGMDDVVARVLLHRILILQNLPPDQRARIFSGVSEHPDVYLDVAAQLYGERSVAGRREWMRDALIAARDRPATADAIDRTVRRWLRAWQPVPSLPDTRNYSEEQARFAREHHNEMADQHRAGIQTLADAERTFVDRELNPLPPGYAHRVDELAIAILAGRPLAGYAADIFAWCVATSIGWEAGGSHDAMRWLRLLAPTDWEEATSAVGAAVAPFRTAARSDVFGWAMSYALSGSGDPEQSRAAADVRPPAVADTRPGRSDVLPDVDPLDPAASAPEGGLEATAHFYREATTSREGHPPGALWRESKAPASRARLLLCRFAPDAAAAIHRDFAAGCAAIADVSPSVIAHWILRDVAILRPVVEPVAAWMTDLRGRPDLEPVERDAPTVLLAAVLPHLEAERQYDAHAGQRDDASDAFQLGELMRALPAAKVEERLRSDFASGEPRRMRLALLATADAGSAVPAVRSHALQAAAHDDQRLRAAAYRAMVRAGTRQDDEKFAAAWRRPVPIVDEAHIRADHWGSLWFRRAGLDADEPSALAKLTPALRSSALEHSGAATLEAAVNDLHRVLRDTSAVGVLPTGMKVAIVRPDDLPARDENSGSWHRIDFGPADGFDVGSGARRPMRNMRDFFALHRDLASSGREMLLHPPSSEVVDRAAREAPSAFERLLALAEEATATERAPVLAVLAHDVARAVSYVDPKRAARLFDAYGDVAPLFPEVLPIGLVPRTSLLLWRSSDDPAIESIRRRQLDRAPNDRAMARLILAAETARRHDLVVAYVKDRATGRHPLDLARAVTAAGFAVSDPALDDFFDDERFRHGFLRDAAAKAGRCYARACWAAHWYGEAVAATDGLGAWRALELALAAADARCVLWLGGSGHHLHGCQRSMLEHRFATASYDRDRDRKGTLYGRSVPPDWMGVAPL